MSTTIESIEKLQKQENDLLQELHKGSGNPNSLITQINSLTDVRMNLYKSLENRYNDLKDLGADSKKQNEQNNAMVNIIEDNLSQSKKRLEDINSSKGSKLRKIEINTYYNQKYQSYIEVLYLIIKVLVVILVLGLVRKVGIIPSNIMNAALTIVAILGLLMILYNAYDISNRNNMYFDEYNSFMNSHSMTDQPSIMEYNRRNFFNKVSGQINEKVDKVKNIPKAFSECVGDSCCGKNTSWNNSLSKCVYITRDKENDESPPGPENLNTESKPIIESAATSV